MRISTASPPWLRFWRHRHRLHRQQQGGTRLRSQALFQARKTWAKDNYKRRLELLQSQQRRIDTASSAAALKSCRRQMKQARVLRQITGLHEQGSQSTGASGAHRQKRDAKAGSSGLSVDQAASRAATPGSTLPSSSSPLALPPEM